MLKKCHPAQKCGATIGLSPRDEAFASVAKSDGPLCNDSNALTNYIAKSEIFVMEQYSLFS